MVKKALPGGGGAGVVEGRRGRAERRMTRFLHSGEISVDLLDDEEGTWACSPPPTPPPTRQLFHGGAGKQVGLGLCWSICTGKQGVVCSKPFTFLPGPVLGGDPWVGRVSSVSSLLPSRHGASSLPLISLAEIWGKAWKEAAPSGLRPQLCAIAQFPVFQPSKQEHPISVYLAIIVWVGGHLSGVPEAQRGLG